MRFKAIFLIGLGALVTSGIAADRANAYVIDFEAIPAPLGGAYTYPGPLVVSTPIGNVTFTGGEVLNSASNAPADESTVYYTSIFAANTTNPITITFPVNITDLYLNLYNGETYPDTFTVSDNLGNTTTQTLVSNTSSGNTLISFPAAGDFVTISTTDPSFDFFIDDVAFDQGLGPNATTPLPATLPLFAGGLGFVGYLTRRRKQNARQALAA